MNLFGDDPGDGDEVKRYAELSDCGSYRWWLRREWNAKGRRVCWVMLNPSKADATEDDATIRRCVGFARGWGAGGISVVNLFAFRSTDPAGLFTAADPVGPRCDQEASREIMAAPIVVAAWGRSGGALAKPRIAKFVELLKMQQREIWCLGRTADGAPKHPVRLPGNTSPELYIGGAPDRSGGPLVSYFEPFRTKPKG